MTNIPNSNGQAAFVIPEYPEITSLTIKLVQIRLSIKVNESRSSISNALVAVLNRVTKSVLRYIVRKIERDAAKRLTCERWFEYDDGVEGIEKRLPPCPCTLLQMSSDNRYREETVFQFIVSRVFFKKSKALSCYRERNIG